MKSIKRGRYCIQKKVGNFQIKMDIRVKGRLVEIWCESCKEKIIYDYDRWLEENPEDNFIQCRYCNNVVRLK